ncbi:MAG: type II toxin-antitoxin system VapC family toxin [Gammaproteobacteria bacterium]|nr:type II toxin-antitoxin system VapC family toxin [Gammaproteobacteria bacterium]
MSFVLDCSVTMSWAFDEERDACSDASLELLREGDAWAPAIWSLEVMNCLLVAERTRRLTRAKVDYFTNRISKFRIHIRSIEFAPVITVLLPLAREYKLSSYDAAYLELAMREGLPLATRDGRLKAAAKRAGLALVTG